jgi:tetratricopeptide (TPR) repeat protein
MSLLLATCLGAALAARAPTDYRAALGADISSQASALNAQGRFKEAAALIERFHSAVEVLAPSAYEAGYALNRLGETEAALVQYSAAIAADPELAAARYDRGEIYLRQSRWAQASVDFEVVVRVRPGHWAGHFRLAQLAGVAVDPAGMDKHLTDAIRSGFDLKVLTQDDVWRRFAKNPELGAVLRKIIILYTDESLLKDLGLQP